MRETPFRYFDPSAKIISARQESCNNQTQQSEGVVQVIWTCTPFGNYHIADAHLSFTSSPGVPSCSVISGTLSPACILTGM